MNSNITVRCRLVNKKFKLQKPCGINFPQTSSLEMQNESVDDSCDSDLISFGFFHSSSSISVGFVQ